MRESQFHRDEAASGHGERVEIPDPVFDALVDEGKAQRIEFEEATGLASYLGDFKRPISAILFRASRGKAWVKFPMVPIRWPRWSRRSRRRCGWREAPA
jgi:hypothetical protein